ncbi:hypothetical protein [uncultured Microscilla sp.]|uniref:hypothetical protein n=1 Tax=uncultured Microscilla sp. TaxID=432653 RepID=UPI002621C592|nr:hypothetical protein [uncultured Microscilla sp.]
MGLFRFIGRLFKLILTLGVVLVALLALAGGLSENFKEFVDTGSGNNNHGDYSYLFKDGNSGSGGGSSGDNTRVDPAPSFAAIIQLTKERNHQKVDIESDNYVFDYVYRDVANRGTKMKWGNRKLSIDNINNRFGLPHDFFKRSFSSEDEIREIAERGYFKVQNNTASPDYNRMIHISRNITRPIYEMIMKKVGQDASYQKPIDELLKFCQDIPYKIPADLYNNKQTGGIFPPSLALTKGYADCDTKAVLFASVLLHNPRYKIVFVTIPGHLFLAIKGVPKPYQKYVTYRGEKYILCEPTGPARLAFGKDGFSNYTINKIEPAKGYYN